MAGATATDRLAEPPPSIYLVVAVSSLTEMGIIETGVELFLGTWDAKTSCSELVFNVTPR